MRYVLGLCLGLFLAIQPVWAGEKVVITTNLGDITVELNEDKAPITAANFLSYVDEGFYNNTLFHRVIDKFMIQGGGFDDQLKQKPTKPPIKNEAGNGLKNNRGTIAMARTNVVDSATSQFFINLVDNDFLNHSGQNASAFGYAVFGQVVDGMDVVDRIAKQPTIAMNRMFANMPKEKVVIQSIRRLQP